MNSSRQQRRRLLARVVSLVACLMSLSLLLAGCGSTTAAAKRPSGPVQVMYAASLEAIMENHIASAFNQSTGYTFQGEAKGSSALANEIKAKLHKPDIFISAAPGVNKLLMGAANGNFVNWYINFARSELVIGYNPNSKFAADFQAVASGTKTWYQVLEEPGLRLGRTDPILDPKGVATIYMMELAETYYNMPNLQQTILGADENTSQIFAEEELVARLTAGQLDAGFFYVNEAKSANIPYVTLPDQINLGNPALASTYSTVTYTNPQTKAVSKGGPIIYTVTIPTTSQNMAGAIAFVNYLLSPAGQGILLNTGGLLSTPFVLTGPSSAVPQELQKYVAS